VPVVAGDDTMLEVVLGRLLAVLENPDPEMIQRITASLAPRTTHEPAGGTEAGVA
jgi:hypothetical protein